MCTVSFITRQPGYLLGMNRDEKLVRAGGLPPGAITVDGHRVICPSEPGGGTWIALNDHGATFALINWYAVRRTVHANPVTRGVVVKTVAGQNGAEGVSGLLGGLPLERMNPFRLIGIFDEHGEVYEWRWDLKTLERKRRAWTSQQWSSSGFDEPEAQRMRLEIFWAALRQTSAGTAGWLRRLHSSHAPVCGPFATCMHRADAVTVSYTEIRVAGRSATMSHRNQAPCLGGAWRQGTVRLRFFPRKRLRF